MARSIGRYEIRSELGRGGMAAVYLAFDPKLDREVALKLMDQQLSTDPTFAARFEREAKTVASLEHGAIVSLYDYGEADGWLFLVMRYMEGGSLKELIAKGPLSAAQSYDVVRRIGSALDKAHSKGIVHRDLKPANILLDEEQESYLSDFGIVKVAKGDTEFLTETGQTLGTFAYMSPEQVMGRELDGRSDLYTLGIVLYEMLAGKHPFGGATTSGAMAVAHAQQTVPEISKDNPALPAALNAVVQKALAKDPNDRYASGREMALALYEALTGKPSAAAATGAAAAGVAVAAATSKPPGEKSPGEKPPGEKSPATPPVTQETPASEPPASEPPASEPAVQQPAAQQPAVQQPTRQPASGQPAAVPTTQPPAKQPAAPPPAEPVEEQKRKTPVWVFAVVGLVAIVCIAVAAVAGLSALGSDTTNTNVAEEPAAEEPAAEEAAAEEAAAEEPEAEEPAPEEPEEEEVVLDLAGETVTIFTALFEEEVALLEDSFRPFEEQTGVDIIVERSDDFQSAAIAQAEAGDPADIYLFPWLVPMIEMARNGFLVDLNQFLDDDYLGQQYRQSFLDMGTVDGTLVGVWHNATPRSVLWYHKALLADFGFDTPQSWDELLVMTEEFTSNGITPWCIGIESGAATGWVGTNWVEDILLRIAGLEVYDQWVAGEVPFSSPEVRTAFEIMGQIWLTSDFVHGGTESISSTFFGDAPAPLFDSPPGCVFHYQGGFITGFFPEGAEVGADVDYVSLPPIDEANFGKPVTVFGSTFSLAKDTPAGRATMAYLTTAESVKAGVQAGTLVAPHNDVPLAWYPDDIQRGYAQIVAEADTVRFDGSDLMPSEVGAGTFWAGVTDYANGVDLDTVLRTIDAR